MKIKFLFFCLFISLDISAQVYFHKRYGDATFFFDDGGYAGYVRQTADSGYIMTCSTRSYSLAGDQDVYLIKTDVNGDTLWTKVYGGIDSDGGNYVEQTTDGGYIIAGVADSCCSGVGGNLFLIKTSSVGDTLWTKTFIGAGSEQAFSAQETTDGGYIITGSTNSFQPSGQCVLIKTNSIGDTLWTKSFMDFVGLHIEQTFDGGYIMAGNTSLGSGIVDGGLLKTDTNGNLIWFKAYGTSNWDILASVKQTPDGGFIATGYTGSDISLVKTDAAGNLLWSNTFCGIGNEVASSIQITTDGGYILCGGYGQIYLVKTDSVGNFLWSRTYADNPKNMDGHCVEQTTDKGFIIQGSIYTSEGEAILIKTDSLGWSNCAYEINWNINSCNVPIVVTTATPVQGFTPFTVSRMARRVSAGSVPTTVCYSMVGINEGNLEEESFLISPNPSNGVFTIESPKGEIEIYNTLGELIYKTKITQQQTEINLSDKPKGIYFIKITSEDKTYSQKLIIQ